MCSQKKVASYGTQYTSLVLETETIGTDTYKYEYDGVGNITSISKKAQGQTAFADVADYTYDSLNQLLTAIDYENNRKYVYTYLPGGNIQQEKIYSVSGNTETLISTNSYTYGDSSWGDLLKKYKNQDITYDTIGDPLTYRDGISFTWTNGRQLASYNDGTTGVAYTYGSDGMRLSKTVGNIQYTYLYLGGLLMQETRGSRVINYFYDAKGQAIALRYRSGPNAEWAYYYYDYNSRGDIVGLYAENGNPECAYTYDPWGKLLSVKNPAGTEMTSATYIGNLQSLKYRGYVYDRETGLYYLQSRYYDPVTRRFINADCFASTGTGILGYNMFAYCENNPVNFFDADGRRLYSSNNTEANLYTYRPAYTDSGLENTMPSHLYARMNTLSHKASKWSYKGWTAHIHSPVSSSDQYHIHVKKDGREYIQNVDGTLHHENKKPGEPPNSVKKNLKEKGIWDWDGKAEKHRGTDTENIVFDPRFGVLLNYENRNQNNDYYGLYGLYYIPIDLCLPGISFSLSTYTFFTPIFLY